MKFQSKKIVVVAVVISATLVGGRALATSPLAPALARLMPTMPNITLPSLPTNPASLISLFSSILGNKASTMVQDGYLNPNQALQQNAPATAVADGVAARLGLNAANARVIEARLTATATAISNSEAADNSLDATKQGNKMLKYVIEQQAQNTQTTQGLTDLAVANQYALNEIKNASREQQIDAQVMSLQAKPFLLFSGN